MSNLKSVPQSPTCETCIYLSDGFRCQRITTSMYARKVTDLTTGCDQWEQHWAFKAKARAK